jgi:GH25 family lysozyme M1 (1,4-beta-N-acetylmuramidase)
MNVKMNGIDVSRWQGVIDFTKVKTAGIDFVIIRRAVQMQNFTKTDILNRIIQMQKRRG